MIDFDTYHQIHRCHKELKLTPVQIAAKLHLQIKTVRKWLAKPRYEARVRPTRRASKLDPYKKTILAWLERHPYSAVQIYQRLCAEHGYTGGKTVLGDYLRLVRPVRHEAFLKLAFAPGDCMQVDWGTHGRIQLGDTVRQLHYFAAVLCHSRMLYVEFFLSQAMECFLAGHRHALEFFGAAPCRAMHDNLKTAVLEHRPHEAPKFHPRYLDFARHYGFAPVACNVRRGNEKGRVENSIGYIQKNFLAGLEISSLGAINIAVRHWLDQIANVRLHRETNARPCDLFLLEKPHLQPLPAFGADISQSRRVRATNRCQVHFEVNRYSVPFAHAGALLELRAEPDTISLYRHDKLLARHPRSYHRNQEINQPEHTNELLKERSRGEDAALRARFLALSPQAELYYGALRQRELHAMMHVRRILLLVGPYSREAVASALGEALNLGAVGSDYLHHLLQHRQTLAPLVGELHLTRSAQLLDLELPPADCSRFELPTSDPLPTPTPPPQSTP